MKLTETRGKRPILRWTAPKGSVAFLLFFMLALFFELLLVSSFLSFGLIDKNAWIWAFQFPATNWSFIVSFSPLFHLLPITVIVVLVSSWVYLTKYTAFQAAKTETARRPPRLTQREMEKRRLKGLRRFFKRINRGMQGIGRSVKVGFQRVPGVSFLSKRLYSARGVVRSALAVFAVFVSMSLLLYMVVYPDMIRQGVLALYRDNSSFFELVAGLRNWLSGLGQALSPIGSLGAAINNALLGVAPGFRQGLAGVGASLTGSIVGMDVTGKYVLIQNVAAWVLALGALIYGSYVSARRPRRR